MKNTISFIIILIAIQVGKSQITFSYDGNGNQVSKQTITPIWDANIVADNIVCEGEALELNVVTDDNSTFEWADGSTASSAMIVVQDNSTFTVTVTSSWGCTKKLEHPFEVIPSPSLDSISGELMVDANFSIYTYTVHGGIGSYYEWIIEGGTITSGLGSNTVSIQWEAVPHGEIHVLEIPQQGCPSDTLFSQVNIRVEQIIPLHDSWNLISTYLTFDDMSPANIFHSELGSNLEKVKDIFSVYDPNAPDIFNTLQELEDGAGYWMDVQNGTDLILKGRLLDPEKTTIQLQQGWNLVGYPCTNPQPVETALADIIPSVEKVKNIFLSYDPSAPEIFNTLSHMQPGEGYWIKVNQPVTFHYPVPEDSERLYPIAFDEIMETTGWNPIPYSNSSICHAEVTMNDLPIQGTGYIGAFVGEECRGISFVNLYEEQTVISMVINGEQEEKLHFKLFLDGKEFTSDFKPSLIPGQSFSQSIIIPFYNLETSISQENHSDLNLQIGPNPCSDEVNIYIESQETYDLEISLFDILGNTLLLSRKEYITKGNSSINIDLEELSNGTYLLEIRSQNSKEIHKIHKTE